VDFHAVIKNQNLYPPYLHCVDPAMQSPFAGLRNGLRVLYPMTLMTRGLYNEPTGAYLPSVLY
jgi:hypothetical protein